MEQRISQCSVDSTDSESDISSLFTLTHAHDQAWHYIKVIFVQHTRLDTYLLCQHKSGNIHIANSARHKHPKNVFHLKNIIYIPYLQLRENTILFIVHSLSHYSTAQVQSSHPTQSGLCPHIQNCPITGRQ